MTAAKFLCHSTNFKRKRQAQKSFEVLLDSFNNIFVDNLLVLKFFQKLLTLSMIFKPIFIQANTRIQGYTKSLYF